ncbi:MAG: hypothetical protein AAGF74_14415 [Pseudomonadota bacterium]
MPMPKPSGSVFALAAVPLAAGITAGSGFVEISLDALDAGDLAARLLALVIIALVVERAVEIVVVVRYPVPSEDPDDRAAKARFARAVSLGLSFFVAAVGLRCLAQFLAAPVVGFSETQMLAFRAVDVALTTLVLAGGAEGVHKIARQAALGKTPARN